MLRFLQPNPDRSQAIRRSLAKLDRQLSQAQQLIGEELSGMDLKAESPRVYKLADDVWAEIERLRRRLQRRR